MRYIEQIQYKLRTFLYEQERARSFKKNASNYKKDTDFHSVNPDKNSPFHNMISSLDEIDAYLEEKIEEWNLKIKK